MGESGRTDPRIDPLGTAGWVDVGIRAGWLLREGISLTISLENLADASYRVHGSGIQAPGRGITTTLRAQF